MPDGQRTTVAGDGYVMKAQRLNGDVQPSKPIDAS
jgi:hypothetical protein